MIKEKFNYLVEGSPIDFFHATFKIEELKENIQKTYDGQVNSDAKLRANYLFIEKTIEELSGEKPYEIRYFSIPNYDYCSMELCAVAKIYNNGTTYTLTNNDDFAKIIAERTCSDIKSL